MMSGPRWLAVLAAVTGLGACTPGADEGSGPLEASLRVAADPAAAGETLPVVLEITNRTDTAVVLDFRTGQRFDFAIRRSGADVSRWSSDMMFPQVLGSEMLEPGESWTLTADLAAPPEPGDYTVVGWLTSEGGEVRDSTTVTLR